MLDVAVAQQEAHALRQRRAQLEVHRAPGEPRQADLPALPVRPAGDLPCHRHLDRRIGPSVARRHLHSELALAVGRTAVGEHQARIVTEVEVESERTAGGERLHEARLVGAQLLHPGIGRRTGVAGRRFAGMGPVGHQVVVAQHRRRAAAARGEQSGEQDRAQARRDEAVRRRVALHGARRSWKRRRGRPESVGTVRLLIVPRRAATAPTTAVRLGP